jgi:hypothetical protein
MRNNNIKSIDSYQITYTALKALGVDMDKLTLSECSSIVREFLKTIDKTLINHDPREGARAMLKEAMDAECIFDDHAVHTTIYFNALDNIEIAIADGNPSLAMELAQGVASTLYTEGWS